MSLLANPTQPDAQSIADALSMATIGALILRGQASGRERVDLDQAYQRTRRYADDTARFTRGLVADNDELGGEAQVRDARLGCAALLACGVVSGLVRSGMPTDEALRSCGRLRERLLPAAQALTASDTPAATAILMGGGLQGALAAGQDPQRALADILSRRTAFDAAAGALQGQDGQDLAASQLYATALAGLVGRGMGVDNALVSVRQQRAAIEAKALQATPAAPGIGQWRQDKAGPQASSSDNTSAPKP